MPTYNRDYFIAKFEAIPTHLWHTGGFVNKEIPEKMCALGHCGWRNGSQTTEELEEGRVLHVIIHDGTGAYVGDINDGHDPRFQQPFAKDRILAALKSFPDEKA